MRRKKTETHSKQDMLHLQQFYTIGLLIIANIFMTFAWYGHLKLQQINVITSNTPLYIIILMSWLLALPEYCCQIPANRIGFDIEAMTRDLLDIHLEWSQDGSLSKHITLVTALFLP